MDKHNLHHLAIILDGNRRWARQRNLPTFEGHRRGFDTIVKISRYIRKIGIPTLTLWAFSTENWNRTKEEISYLMKLYILIIDKYFNEALREEVKVTHLGRKDRLPNTLVQKIENIEDKTKHFTKHYLNIALDYGGRDEIIRAIKKLSSLNSHLSTLDEQQFETFLDTAGQPYPNPDLIIRTGGAQRTSGFMIWQAAYAEYIFLEKYLPELNEEDIDNAIKEYQNRERRFGK